MPRLGSRYPYGTPNLELVVVLGVQPTDPYPYP